MVLFKKKTCTPRKLTCLLKNSGWKLAAFPLELAPVLGNIRQLSRVCLLWSKFGSGIFWDRPFIVMAHHRAWELRRNSLRQFHGDLGNLPPHRGEKAEWNDPRGAVGLGFLRFFFLWAFGKIQQKVYIISACLYTYIKKSRYHVTTMFFVTI